ncbi:MAG: hypothetical protein KJ044_10420, partial [Planctomycetes bacterium]|nr:hypothetical protein [Planctomycetota bacterium]
MAILGWNVGRGAALAASLLGMALVLGACGGDNKKSGGGGGGGPSYAPPPTARPTQTGMAVRMDLSGGDGTAGNGGFGGELGIVAAGWAGVGGSAPGVDNNFVTAAALSGNTVTYAELAAISTVAFSLNTTTFTAYIDLFGFDFHIPTGATLDLSDAVAGTVDHVVIRTHGAGDVIRIDGAIVTTRTGAKGASLTLQAIKAAGASVYMGGTATLNGAAGQPGSDISLYSGLGNVVLAGTIASRGSNAATGQDGGDVLLQTDAGNVLIAPGLFQMNGGGGTGTGGNGGLVQFYANSRNQDSNFPWGIQMNGGASGTGYGG